MFTHKAKDKQLKQAILEEIRDDNRRLSDPRQHHPNRPHRSSGQPSRKPGGLIGLMAVITVGMASFILFPDSISP